MDREPPTGPRAVAALCYPRYHSGCLARAVRLEAAGVEEILFCGSSHVLVRPGVIVEVLGKGHASTVVAATSRYGLVAVKARRTDSKRESLAREAGILRRACRVGATPCPYYADDDLIVMDLVAGPPLGEALHEHTANGLIHVVEEAVEAAYALDTAMVLHKELGRPWKHILFTGPPHLSKALVIDLESASTEKCGNVPKVVGAILAKLDIDPGPLRGTLRRYKDNGCPSSLYGEILNMVRAILLDVG
ncbi:MAG: hypothetical protein F7C35_00270 [Desulfurococcales archaeon]|nr:hypothetical protein [Desulfurococcales archaeon]